MLIHQKNISEDEVNIMVFTRGIYHLIRNLPTPIISYYITLGPQMAYACQIWCLKAVLPLLAIGFATNSNTSHVFIRFQYGVFTE